jgi:hypothetical protein
LTLEIILMKPSTKCIGLRLRGMAIAAACCAAVGLVTTAFAAPISYRASVVTNIRLGAQNYQNAALDLTFSGDTADIGPVTDSSGNPLPGNCYFQLSKGRASFSFETGGTRVAGQFLPGQLFVALDACAAGIGLGSFTGPNGFEPVYPLGFTHGSADNFAAGNPSALSTHANVSGNAWSCIGYPPSNGGSCTAPDAYPLHTNLGQDLFVYMPYLFICGYPDEICLTKSGSMNRGTFSIMSGADDD